MTIDFKIDDRNLSAVLFHELAQRVWPRTYDTGLCQAAVARTFNNTAWECHRLVGCVRLLSDGYFFGTIPEILVDPE